MSNTKKIDATVLFLTVSDQRSNALCKYPGIDLHCNYELDKNWSGGLERLFSRVVKYDFLKNYAEEGIKKVNSDIIEIVAREKPKYVIWPSFMYEILESTFETIMESGSIIIGYFFDDQSRFDSYSKYWIPYLDYIITVDDESSVMKYSKFGVNAIYKTCGVSPDIYHKKEVPNRFDVSFVGSKIGNREESIKKLIDAGIKVAAFGKGWNSGYVSFDEMIDIFNSSKINLNFVGDGTINNDTQIKGRIFEICMCGGFLLTEYANGLEQYFELDKEIVCFHSISEAMDKARYYLENENERMEMAEAGWQKVNLNYTWEKHFRDVFDVIESGKVDRIKADLIPLPQDIKKIRANWHSSMAYALYLERGNSTLWTDELELSLSYDPSNRQTRYLHAIGRFPPFVRPWLIRLYPALSRLGQVLLSRLRRLFG
ncbi:glycosyltransferase [bacterium]|nr:glycosyltransferase [bacterium]